jgi:hypothetical protein
MPRRRAPSPSPRWPLPAALAALLALTATVAAGADPLQITTASLGGATAGVAYSDSVRADGGTAPYTWSLDDGSLPAGLTLDSDTGNLTGTANLAEQRSFIVRATDSLGDTATRALSLTVSPGAAAQLAVVQQPGGTTAGTVITPHLKAQLRDAFDNDVAESGVEVTATLSSGTGALLGTTARNTDGAGIAEFDDLSIDLAGSKQLTASGGALTPATSTSFNVTAATAAGLSFDVGPSPVTAGATMSPAVRVKVADAFGNGVAGEAVSLALVGTGALTGGGAVDTDASGIAEFATLSIDLADSKQLTASSGALTPVTSASFNVTAAAAAALSFDVGPSPVTAGAAMSPAVRVKVADAFGNDVAGEPVSLALVGSGSLTGGGAVNTDTSGIAEFATLSIDLAGSKQLTASSGALTPVTSTSFNVTAATAAALSFDVGPSPVTAGATMSPAVRVKVVDAFGNAVAGEAVSLALVGAGALTGGGAVNTDTSGIAEFATLSIDLAGSKQLTASSGALTPVTSASFNVTAASAVALSFDVGPSPVTAGATMSPAVRVKVVDAFGNGVAGEPVSLALVGSGALTGGGGVNSDASGIAEFATLSIDLAGSKQLTASSGALTPVTSASFNVTAAAAAALSFDVGPSPVTAGATMSPAVRVKVADAFGNGVAGEPVALALVGTGALTGGGAVNSDASGIAEFAALSIDLAGSKQLTASSGALTPVASASFNVTASAPAILSFEVGPSAALVGAVIAPSVELKVTDASSNPLSGVSVSLSLVGTGTLSGGGPVLTNPSGIATFAGLSVDRAGSKQLSATTATLGPVSSAAFAISCPTSSLSPPTLPAGTVGVAYSQLVSASGGTGPYTFAVTAGAPPSGLTLDSGSGVLAGTPTSSGTFNFTVTATDANACSGILAYSLGICPVIAVLPSSLPPVTVGTAYSQTLSAGAGTAPFTFTIVAGALPAGLTLSSAGLLSGTPGVSGSFPFMVGVSDAGGCGGSRAYTLEVPGFPAAIANLAAPRRTSGNDADGTVKIDITFTNPAFAVSAEIYRAPFGHYPQYDDAGGVVPPMPSYPPGPPWTLTGVAASGQYDEPASRDFYYYVAFTKNAAGATSPVSNRTSGTANYHLGDVSNGVTAGAGDNQVGPADVSLLGAHYGISGSAITSAGVEYLDVGPTTDLQLTSRPFTDRRINFEDLIVFASNYGVVSTPLAAARAADNAANASGSPERLAVESPSLVEAGATLTAALTLEGAGRVQGLSVALEWDRTVVEPIGVTGGGLIEGQGGVVLSSAPGTVDGALLGVRERGITGSGQLATFRFRALRQGDPAIRIASVSARDAANRPLAEGALVAGSNRDLPARTLLLAPFPNPSRFGARIEFALARAAQVDLSIYSVDGRRVRTIVRGPRAAGAYRFQWAGDDDQRRAVPPGVYYVHLSTGAERFTRALVQLR